MKVFVVIVCVVCACCGWAVGDLRFSVDDTKLAHDDVPMIVPWRTVTLDADYGGQWVIAGDLDKDGVPEIIAAENHNEGDVHYTSAVVAQNLNGEVLWQWGKPDIGRKTWHHDVACQMHDWDGNGQVDVIVCDEGALVEIDGHTGAEKRRIEIDKEATDCVSFCDLSGVGRPTDVLVKNRYEQIWAYDKNGNLLWTVNHPGGYRTAHQVRAIDLDGDGRDELMAGYACLNHDGLVRWVYESEKVDLKRGHLDCARVLECGAKPEEWRIVMTFCGANAIVACDGNGKSLWEVTGYHFESINIGKLAADLPGMQLLVDIDHQPEGHSPIWALDGEGNQLGELITDYSRHHKLIDWSGDGVAEIVVAHNRAMYDALGKRLGTFEVSEDVLKAAGSAELCMRLADMDGDGVQDLLLVLPTHVMIYRNEAGAKPAGTVPLGTELNATLY